MTRFASLWSARLPRALAFAASVLLGCAVNSSGERAMAADTAVIGWIEILPLSGRQDHITVRGHIQALKPVTGAFVLRVRRTSGGNTSDTKQSGAFSAQAGETQPLSTTTINLGPNDRLEFVLTVSVDGADVFTAALRSS